MEKGKILYIGCDVPDGDAPGLRVFSNAIALSKFGFDVHILSLDKEGITLGQNRYKDIKIHRKKYPFSKKEYLKYLFEINAYKRVIEEINDVKCVICYELPSFSTAKLYRYCKRNKIKMICDVTEWHTSKHLKGISKLVKFFDVWNCMHIAYKKCDGLFVVSSFLANHFKKKKSILIPPLQFGEKGKPISNELTRFIYAGSPDADKDNILNIIECLNLVEIPFNFDIYGIENIYNITNEKIHFHGRVSRDTVVNQLRKSDFQIILRDSTRRNNAGFPTKFAESIYNGVPVIVSNFSDTFEYLDTYNIGIKVINNDLKNAIYSAINMDFSDKQKMKEECLSSNLFDCNSYIDRIGKFVESIIFYPNAVDSKEKF